MSDPSSQPTQPLTDAEPCQPVYVHTYGLDRATWEKLFDRVADAAHALDEEVSCSGGNACNLCEDPDWADLREMARNAGFSVRTEPIGLRPVETKVWAHYPPGDRYPDGIRGWARVAYGRNGACRISVEMHAPGRDPRSRVDLVDPSPAEVLTAARLLGLVGGTS